MEDKPMTPQRFINSGIMNGCNLIMAQLIRDLDARGLLSKNQFADHIEPAVAGLPLKEPNGNVRYDRLMIENLVKLLRGPQSGWTPTVIQGGLSDPEGPENFDP
jgi:hypothetical protein